jgi:Aspartyl/Asparaginyl beta-hydroxylase
MQTVLTNELSTIDWLAAGTSEVGPDGSTVVDAITMGNNNLVPLSLLRSTSQTSWLEYGPLYDGSNWDVNLCKHVHTLCRVLRSHESLLCSSGNDTMNACGTDSIVTLVRIQPGTIVLPHCGMNNRHLTLYWCLSGCTDVGLSVTGGETASEYGSEGDVIVFDDSFEHSIQHKGKRDAVIAAVFLDHPNFIP